MNKYIILYYIILYYIILYYIILYYIILYYIILYYNYDKRIYIKNLIDSQQVKKFLALYRAVFETVLFTEIHKSNSFPQPPVSEIVS